MTASFTGHRLDDTIAAAQSRVLCRVGGDADKLAAAQDRLIELLELRAAQREAIGYSTGSNGGAADRVRVEAIRRVMRSTGHGA